jgi:hypothetical protein
LAAGKKKLFVPSFTKAIINDYTLFGVKGKPIRQSRTKRFLANLKDKIVDKEETIEPQWFSRLRSSSENCGTRFDIRLTEDRIVEKVEFKMIHNQKIIFNENL